MEKQSGLVIIDMQEGILKLKQPVYNERKLIENINKLIDWAKNNEVKVFYSQHENTTFLKYGSLDWKIIKDLQITDDAVIVYKKQSSIFTETELYNELKTERISKIYVAVLILNGCIKDSCLDALNKDFEVVLFRDAHSTLYKNAEELICQINNEMKNAGVVLQTTEGFIK